MAYDENLATRIRIILENKNILFDERKMFGGLCFMVADKMCIGIANSKLMARIDPDIYEDMLQKSGCHEMDFTGRPMKGFLFIDPQALKSEKELTFWIDLCLEYNPKAKSSKK